jgi:hypothetical protein
VTADQLGAVVYDREIQVTASSDGLADALGYALAIAGLRGIPAVLHGEDQIVSPTQDSRYTSSVDGIIRRPSARYVGLIRASSSPRIRAQRDQLTLQCRDCSLVEPREVSRMNKRHAMPGLISALLMAASALAVPKEPDWVFVGITKEDVCVVDMANIKRWSEDGKKFAIIWLAALDRRAIGEVMRKHPEIREPTEQSTKVQVKAVVRYLQSLKSFDSIEVTFNCSDHLWLGDKDVWVGVPTGPVEAGTAAKACGA